MNKNNKIVLGLGFLIVMIFLIIFVTYSEQENNKLPYKDEKFDFPDKGFVGKVIDGDTVIIDGESVRLLGIDTDEKGYDCYEEAKERLEELILEKEVELVEDTEDKDIYGRRLRWLFIDGKNINLQMVEEGLAIARFYEEKKYREEILTAEKEARQNRLGCKWKDL